MSYGWGESCYDHYTFGKVSSQIRHGYGWGLWTWRCIGRRVGLYAVFQILRILISRCAVFTALFPFQQTFHAHLIGSCTPLAPASLKRSPLLLLLPTMLYDLLL